jgi:hypothetical protein
LFVTDKIVKLVPDKGEVGKVVGHGEGVHDGAADA